MNVLNRLAFMFAPVMVASSGWAQTPPPPPPPAVQPTPSATSPLPETTEDLKELTWVGFQQFADTSRVFVRTSDPVHFQIRKQSPQVLELILQNTKSTIANHTRFLDTQYFDSNVRFIQPKVIEGPSPSIRIEVYLRDAEATYRETQSGTTVSLDFPR